MPKDTSPKAFDLQLVVAPVHGPATQVIVTLRQKNEELAQAIIESGLNHSVELAERDVKISKLEVEIAERDVRGSGCSEAANRALAKVQAGLEAAQAAKQAAWTAWSEFQDAKPQ
jgi:hypothetical protein